MSEETSFSAVPENIPSYKLGDPEPSAEVLNVNIEQAACQTDREDEGGNSHPEPFQPTSNISNEGNKIASKPPVSERKRAANRKNATRSSGPKTESGKANSAKNAIKHGIYARKLFSQTEHGAKELLEYEELATQLVDHYQPVGFKEQLLVEQIFTQLVRNGRILKYEEVVLTETGAFMGQGLEKVLRYSTSHGRELSRLMKELEVEQAKRKS
jgi:hypothetical protein